MKALSLSPQAVSVEGLQASRKGVSVDCLPLSFIRCTSGDQGVGALGHPQLSGALAAG